MSTKSLSVTGAATYEVNGYIENPVEHYQYAQAYIAYAAPGECTLSRFQCTSLRYANTPHSYYTDDDVGVEVQLLDYDGNDRYFAWIASTTIECHLLDKIGALHQTAVFYLNIDFNSLNYHLQDGHYLMLTVCGYTSFSNNDTAVYPKSASITYQLPVAAPTITSHPSSKTVVAGNSATFSVSASGSSLSYQWQRSGDNIGQDSGSSSSGDEYIIEEPLIEEDDGGSSGTWTDISGATSSSLTISTSSSDGGKQCQYRCKVTNSGGSVTSNAATLTVNTPVPAPTISTDPSSQAIFIGQSATFSVSASGQGTLSYQWKYSTDGSNWSSISGATSSSYTISSATSAMNGRYYRCAVTNAGGTTNSNSAKLTVYAKPSITSQPESQTIAEGSAAYFTVSATGQSISYQWQYSDDSGSTWSNLSGQTSSTIGIIGSTSNNNRRFRCVVSNTSGSVNSSSAKLTVVSAPTISTNPTSRNVLVGDTVYFSVTASGASRTYEWYYSTDGSTWTKISGATEPSYSFTAAASQDGRRYRCKVSNLGGSVTSSAATLSVYSPLKLTPVEKTVTAGTSVSYTISNRHDETVNVKCYYSGTSVKTISSQTTDTFSVTFGNDLCKQHSTNRLEIDIIVTAPLLNRQVTAKLFVNENTSLPPTVTVTDFHPVKKSGATDSSFTSWIKDYSRAYFEVSVTTSGSSTVANNGVVLSYPGGTNVIATQKSGSTYYALTAEPLSAAPVTLTMTVTDTNGNTATATQTVSTLSDSTPTIGTVSVAPVTATNPSNFPNVYISGRTKVTCAVAVSSPFSFNISSVTLSYPGGTTVNAQYKSGSGKWEATTAEPIPGNVTFTMTATDANGTTATKTVKLTEAIVYTEPYVTVNTPVRCNSKGTKKAGGAYCKFTVTQHYCTDLTGNSVVKLTGGLKGGTAVDLVSGTQAIVSGLAINTAAYVLEIIIQDQVSSEIKKYLVVAGQNVTTNANQVIYVDPYGNSETFIDLTEDTVVHSQLKHGVVAVNKAGSKILGTVITRSANEIKIANGSVVIPAGFYASDVTIEIP